MEKVLSLQKNYSMLIGRFEEQKVLKDAAESEYSEFVAVYGRRRVGKTFLVRETFNYEFTFQHTGLANSNMSEQLFEFRNSLVMAGHADCKLPKNWNEAFFELEIFLKSCDAKKKIVFLDELPWMDTPKSGFLSAFEHFWNGWASARRDILLIICGSATSWIIGKIIRNHGGLHNRITQSIALQPFTLHECELYAKNLGLEMSHSQMLENYMIMGGIPYYWHFLKKGQSLAQNIDRIFFSPNGELKNEFSSLYSSLFKAPEFYVSIVTILGKKKVGMTREELISNGLTDNGMLSKALDELECCGFIRHYNKMGNKVKSAVYQLIDNFSLFYFKFIQSNNNNDSHFWSNSIDSAMHRVWAGLAFERVCLQHIDQIKSKLGISGVLCNVYSWRSNPSADGMKGAQIDLLIDRNDNTINLCEMKYSSDNYLIDKDFEASIRNKKAVFTRETNTRKAVHVTLVTTFGVVRNMYADAVQNVVTADDLFKEI